MKDLILINKIQGLNSLPIITILTNGYGLGVGGIESRQPGTAVKFMIKSL